MRAKGNANVFYKIVEAKTWLIDCVNLAEVVKAGLDKWTYIPTQNVMEEKWKISNKNNSSHENVGTDVCLYNNEDEFFQNNILLYYWDDGFSFFFSRRAIDYSSVSPRISKEV